MDNSDIDSAMANGPGSQNSLLSIDTEVQQRLEYHYTEINFLEGASAAIHDCLQHDCHSSGPGDEGEVTSDAGNITHDDPDNDQNYHEDNFISGEADMECYDDFQEEQYEEEGKYDNDEYRD